MATAAPTNDQQRTLELMKSLNTFVNDANSKGYTAVHLVSAFVNMGAMIAAKNGGKGKEFAQMARQVFNEMRDAMKATP